jgi:prevent-host-death family protein
MTPQVSIAEAKSHLSELIAKSSYNNEKFIITRRNKPVAALVSIDDLRIIEQHEQRQGLASLTGRWKGFEEVAEYLDDLKTIREIGEGGRDVSF